MTNYHASPEPPTVIEGYIDTWILARAKEFAELLEARGYSVDVTENTLTVKLNTSDFAVVARFLGELRDLGFVFFEIPRSFSPVSAIKKFKREGMLKGEFLELKRTPSNQWWLAPID